MADCRAGQRPHDAASVATGEIEEPEGAGYLLDQRPVQDAIDLAMEDIVVVDQLAIGPPRLDELNLGLLVGDWSGDVVLSDVDHG